MPRSRGGRSAPARAPASSAPSRPQAQAPPPRPMTQQQQRPMTTNAPAQQAQAPVGKSPGLFGQMASTAAGVAVGSSIGHAIGGFFGGGSSQPAQESYEQPTDAYAQPADNNLYYNQYSTQSQAQQNQNIPCANDVKLFSQCMDQNRGDLTICGWYMEQLKACQQAARNY